MADITDVGQSLVDLIAGIAYPNGANQPSISAGDILVYQGWPIPEQLAKDLPDGKVHISVFPRPGEKKTWVGTGEPHAISTNDDGSVNYIQEIERRKCILQITIWASNYDLRNPVSKAVDSALSAVKVLAVSDGTSATFRFSTSTQGDNSQRQGIYRRDLMYSVEYSIVLSSIAWPITGINLNLNVAPIQSSATSVATPSNTNINITNT